MKFEDIMKLKEKCLHCIWGKKIPTGRGDEKVVMCFFKSCPQFTFNEKMKKKKKS